MAKDRGNSLLEELEETLADEFDKDLIESYAKNLDYNELEQKFREQLIQEISHEDET